MATSQATSKRTPSDAPTSLLSPGAHSHIRGLGLDDALEPRQVPGAPSPGHSRVGSRAVGPSGRETQEASMGGKMGGCWG
uniref:Uncharacterized protein n=1 Tax=Chelonoidis abingdonii TaxID=106734 RepID=A0A8C0FZ45_CHEAB